MKTFQAATLLLGLALAACVATEPEPERTGESDDGAGVGAEQTPADDYKPGDPINNLCAPVGAWCNTTTGKGYPYEWPLPGTYDPAVTQPACYCRCYTAADCAAAPKALFPKADCGLVPGTEPTGATFCRANCDDGNHCTKDFVSNGACVNQKLPTGTACGDGYICDAAAECVPVP